MRQLAAPPEGPSGVEFGDEEILIGNVSIGIDG